MIGYVTAWDGITLNSGFGQTQVSISRSAQQSRARILGGADYDLDGYTSPVQRQNFVAQFNDRSGNVNARAMHQRLGRSGWLRCKSRDGSDKQNWAKLISIDAQYTPNDWITSDANPYTLTWSCSPYWYDIVDSTATLTAATILNITNSGNAKSSWMMIYITSSIAAALDIRIGRNSGSTYNVPKYNDAVYDASDERQTIRFNTSKTSSSTLLINCMNNSVTLNGNDDYADIVLPSTQSSLGFLHPGVNRFSFSSAVTGRVVYRSAYV